MTYLIYEEFREDAWNIAPLDSNGSDDGPFQPMIWYHVWKGNDYCIPKAAATAAATATAVMPETDEIDNAAGEPSADNNDIDDTSEAEQPDKASDAAAIVKNKPLTKRQVQKKCIYHKYRRQVVEEQNKYSKAATSVREADEANHNLWNKREIEKKDEEISKQRSRKMQKTIDWAGTR